MKTKEMKDSDELLQTYYNQIKKVPLLTFEEELELSRRIQKGDEAARRTLIESNLRLVVKIARPYRKTDVALMDIIQEGNMGLMHAAEKYDHRKNVRFSTYAAWWIRQSIERYLVNHRRTIRLSHRKEEILRKIQSAYHHLSQKQSRTPNAGEIAAEIGVKQHDVEFVMSMAAGTISLEAEATGNEGIGMMDTHEDYTYNPERNFLLKNSQEETLRFLDRLPEREKRVLMYRFELNGGERYTLKKIGDKLGVSAETVRQIEMRTLRTLRPHIEELRDCLYVI